MRTTVMARAAQALALLLIATVAVTLQAGPASAITQCTNGWQERSYDIPDRDDETVSAKVCIQKDGNYRRAYITISWTSHAGWPWSDRAFDKYILRPRLERYDNDHETAACDVTDDVNGLPRSKTCYTPWEYSTVDGGWTGDGSNLSNVNNDGKGDYSWALQGTPVLY